MFFSGKQKRRPEPADVARRFLVLREVFVKGVATPPVDQLNTITANWSDSENREFDRDVRSNSEARAQKLRDLHLWDYAEESERQFILAGPWEISYQSQLDSIWLPEAIVCLLWALNHVESIPAYDCQADPDVMKTLPGNSVRDCLRNAQLRPRAEIDAQRNLAELWHWRCRTRQLHESGRMPAKLQGGMTIDQVIQLSAAKSGEEFAFSPIDGDFPAFNQPFRAVTAEQFSILQSIAMERHKAFNWLCGYAPENRWSETPTDT